VRQRSLLSFFAGLSLSLCAPVTVASTSQNERIVITAPGTSGTPSATKSETRTPEQEQFVDKVLVAAPLSSEGIPRDAVSPSRRAGGSRVPSSSSLVKAKVLPARRENPSALPGMNGIQVASANSRVVANATIPSRRAVPRQIPARNLGQRFEHHERGRTPASDATDLSSWSLQDKIGQLLIVGYRSPQQIRKLKVGGLVLFAWNLGDTVDETRAVVQKLKGEASRNLKAPLFLATDQEGGRVLRIREGMTPFPDAAAMGAMQDPYTAFRVGKAMGVELASLGLNMNFAPVLDMGNAKSFLGNRVWSDSVDGVGFPAISFIRGQRAAGILDVAKHFPGHGMTSVDSHFGLPQIQKTREELLREDLAPFRLAIGEGVLALMTAHVEYPKIAPGPASLSSVFLTDILRKEMGFEGLVITDDLEMDGVKVGAGQDYGDLALKALQAGSDMILLVWSKDRQESIVKRVEKAVRSGELSEAWLDEKVRRILSVKAKSIGLRHDIPENPRWKENLRRKETLELAREVSERAIRWLAGPEMRIRADLKQRWNESWRVYLPQKQLRELWLDGRPQDKAILYSPRGRDQSAFLGDLEGRICDGRNTEPVLVLTPPRKDLKEDLFWALGKVLGKQALRPESSKSVLWIHQGLQPVLIRNPAASQGIGMLSLFSASELSLEALQAQLAEISLR
jgi:beta-glucosidase-like glycosyl hydrolase